MLKTMLFFAKEAKAFQNFNSFQHATGLAVLLCKQSEGWLQSSFGNVNNNKVISNKEYTALIIVSTSWVYFVGANLVFALSIGRIQDSPLLLPDGGDTRINAWPKR